MGLGSIGFQELLIILFILLIIFGGKKLPELAAGLGKGIREFKKATREPDPEPRPRQELREPTVEKAPSEQREEAKQASE